MHDERLAINVGAYQLSRPLGSVFEVGVTARRGVEPERLEERVRTLLSELCEKGPTEAELSRVVRRFETRFLCGLQTLERRAELLNTYAEALGRPDGVAVDLSRYRQVDRGAVTRACRAVLGRPGCRVWVVPRKEGP